MAHAQRAAGRQRRSIGALVALLALAGILGMHVVESRTVVRHLPTSAVAPGSTADTPVAPVLDAPVDHAQHHAATCRSCNAPLAFAEPVAPTSGGDLVAVPEHPLSSHPPDRSASPP